MNDLKKDKASNPTALLACPFCGRKADILDMKSNRFHVVCNGCHAQMGTDWDDRWSKDDLVKMWNRRAC